MTDPPRHSLVYVLLFLLTICLGLASRHFPHSLPPLLSKNAGDVLYATMTFWLARLLLPRISTGRAALAAFVFCVAIEFAKFIQTPWLVAVRHQAWGHLVLGSGFHVSNLVCYGVGVLIGVGVELGMKLQRIR